MASSKLDSVVSIRFSAEEVERLRNEAETEEISVSNLIRKAALARLAPSTKAAMPQMSSTTTGVDGSVPVRISLGESQVVRAVSEPEIYSVVE